MLYATCWESREVTGSCWDAPCGLRVGREVSCGRTQGYVVWSTAYRDAIWPHRGRGRHRDVLQLKLDMGDIMVTNP